MVCGVPEVVVSVVHGVALTFCCLFFIRAYMNLNSKGNLAELVRYKHTFTGDTREAGLSDIMLPRSDLFCRTVQTVAR